LRLLVTLLFPASLGALDVDQVLLLLGRRRRGSTGRAPAGRGGHHQVLTLRACSIFPAGGGVGQAGAVLEPLQARPLLPGAVLDPRCARRRPGAVDRRRRRGSGCGAPAGRDGHHQVLTLRACSRLSAGGGTGQAGAVLELLQARPLPPARCWILGVLDVDQVLLIGAGGADLVVELLQGEMATTRC